MTAIYHITHIKNLPRIIQAGGLHCDRERIRWDMSSVGIAHQRLKERRTQTPVPFAAGGMLADYVPFYFTTRSPMLYSIHTGFVESFQGTQAEIIYLVSSAERIAQTNAAWCFTDGHAVEAVTSFFADLQRLDRIDWSVIQSWSWRNTQQDPDRKRRKQAEFLVWQFFRWEWVQAVGVINATIAQQVLEGIRDAEYRPQVQVQPKWYYQEVR